VTAGFCKRIKYLRSEESTGFLDELNYSDLLRHVKNYEDYTNTATALRILLASLYDWQLCDFPSSEVRLKNAYSSSLNWLYW
jgi:hypothetical protein